MEVARGGGSTSILVYSAARPPLPRRRLPEARTSAALYKSWRAPRRRDRHSRMQAPSREFLVFRSFHASARRFSICDREESGPRFGIIALPGAPPAAVGGTLLLTCAIIQGVNCTLGGRPLHMFVSSLCRLKLGHAKIVNQDCVENT